MRYVADSQAALDVIILNGNRLVASVGFTFFSRCNLAFTMSFMWLWPLRLLTSLSGSRGKTDNRQAPDTTLCFSYPGEWWTFGMPCRSCMQTGFFSYTHTHTHTHSWLMLNWERAPVLLSELGLVPWAFWFLDICRYNIHATRSSFCDVILL